MLYLFLNTVNHFRHYLLNQLMRFFGLAFLSVILFSSLIGFSFAQSSYDINIPTGAASPDAPYFWQSEKDGSTTGNIEIVVNDEVIWQNADTAVHTVTSGTPDEGPDGIFDSGMIGPGKQFPRMFTEKGHYPYYCVVHPWMTGTVIVTEGYSIIPKVGKNIGDGKTTFDVEYEFNRLLTVTDINPDANSITFEITGKAKSDDHYLSLRLPTGLIDGPLTVWVDGKRLSGVESMEGDDLTILDMELTADSKLITVVGTSVVPEFGLMSIMILGMSVSAVLFIGYRSSLFSRLHF